jgi:hypothetical protein
MRLNEFEWKWYLQCMKKSEWYLEYYEEERTIFAVHEWERMILQWALFDHFWLFIEKWLTNDQEWIGNIVHDC